MKKSLPATPAINTEIKLGYIIIKRACVSGLVWGYVRFRKISVANRTLFLSNSSVSKQPSLAVTLECEAYAAMEKNRDRGRKSRLSTTVMTAHCVNVLRRTTSPKRIGLRQVTLFSYHQLSYWVWATWHCLKVVLACLPLGYWKELNSLAT